MESIDELLEQESTLPESSRVAKIDMDRFSTAIRTAVPYVLVIVFQFLLLYPLHRTMDLPIWDEAVYMGHGEQFIHGGTLGPLSESPFLALLYSLFVRAFGTVQSVFCMPYFVKTAVSLALLFFLSTHLRSRLLAFLLTLIWVVSGLNLWVGVLAYHAALGLYLLALALLNKYRLVSLSILGLCVLTRMEYLLPAIALAIYVGWTSRANKRNENRIPQFVAASLLALLVLYVSFNVSNYNLGGARTWFAFNQHYSVAQVDAQRFNLNPYIDSNVVIQADFPGATSLRDALRVNPHAFEQYVTQNAFQLPRTSARALKPYTSRRIQGVIFGVLAGFAVMVVALSPLDKDFFLRLLHSLGSQKMMWFASAVSIAALIPVLLVSSRSQYTMILVPFLLFWPGFVCLEMLSTIEASNFYRALIALNVIFALGILTLGKPYTAPTPDVGRPVLGEINRLIEIWPKGRMKLMGVGSTWYTSYLGSQRVSTYIEPLATVYGGTIANGSGGMYALLDRYRPDVVLVNSELALSKNFDTASFSALKSRQWVLCPVGSSVFFFRADKFPVRASSGCFEQH